MPELPEVETVRLSLSPAIGQVVQDLWLSSKKLRHPADPKRLHTTSRGATIASLRRLGKYLLVDFANRDSGLLIHLGMSGRLCLVNPGAPRVDHTHAIWTLGPALDLRFSDPRRFGCIQIFRRNKESEHPLLAKMGPDPLVHGINATELWGRLKASRRSLKALILDQAVLAGIGNIYACEALWKAELDPKRTGTSVTLRETKALRDAILQSLNHALTHGGTSLRDFVSGDGKEGSHREYLWVYDREGKPCLRCQSVPILRHVLGGRSTYFCPNCQK